MARVWKRKDRDVWVADFRDGSGRRMRLSADTREQAEDLLAEQIRESRRRRAPSLQDPDINLRDYGILWLDQVRFELESKTFEGYKQHLQGHILPEIGSLRVRDLHRGHIKTFLIEKRKRYAKNTVRLMRAALSSMLTDAVDDGLIAVNPALLIANRKKKRLDCVSQIERQQKIRPMNWEQLCMFLTEAHEEHLYGTFFVLLAKTGMRPGEARALFPGDVDWHNNTARVERALSGDSLKSTKTEDARVVDLSADVVERLRAQVARIRMEALKRGQGEPRWLFPNSVGAHLDKNNIARAFRRVLRKAHLPSFRLYDLRHTYAILLLAAGAPITYVSAQLGHRKPTTTLQYYARWISGRQQRYVDLLDSGPVVSLGVELRKVGDKSWHQNLAPKAISKNARLQVVDSIGGAGGDRTRDLLTASRGRGEMLRPFCFIQLRPNPLRVNELAEFQELQESHHVELLSVKFGEITGTKTDTVKFAPP